DVATGQMRNLAEYEIQIRDYALPKKPEYKNKKLTELLLSAPTITDDELESYNNVREQMNQWTITKF
ncbi:MAG: hypothetical protein AAF639_40780, partial [Chloroflexota bacterium]